MVCPSIGIYKGNLFVRAGIDKIQLTKSMRKVGPSTSKKKAFNGAFLIINQVYPSSNNEMMEREINPLFNPPPKTSEKNLEGIPIMVLNLLRACGVPVDTLEEYKTACKQYKYRNHANLVGVCDCTVGALPQGTVYISGIGVGGGMGGRKVAITRVPCTEPDDLKLVPVISEKPREMRHDDWAHLKNLPFGAIVFSSPRDDESMSLVESINKSDLDGDNFFTLWEPTILPHLENIGSNHDRKLTAPIEEDEDQRVLSEDDEDVEDDLLGVQVPLEIDGKTRNFVVACKTEDGDNYVAKYGEHEKIISPDDLVADRATIDAILNHRGKGKNAELCVQWEGESARGSLFSK